MAWNPFASNKDPQPIAQETLTPKQERLTDLVQVLTDLLPPAARVMLASSNILGRLSQQFDDEKIDALLTKFKEVIDYVEFGGDSPIAEDGFSLGAAGDSDADPDES